VRACVCVRMSEGEGLKASTAEMKGLAQLVSPGLSRALFPWHAESRSSSVCNREQGCCVHVYSVDVGVDAHVLQVEGGARCR